MYTLIEELNRELPSPIPTPLPANWHLVYDPQRPGLLEITEKGMLLRYPNRVQLCRLLAMAADHPEPCRVEEQARFSQLSFMLDCSRNAVPRVETVKKLLRRMAVMGYHALLLYTEDTYTLEDYPYFGHMRGRYSRQELREMGDYAAFLGIEVIPCIQTLAHLNALFHWSAFSSVRDTGDILLCDWEETEKLIRAMVETCRDCFRSRKIHIGMDEAEMTGLGRYLTIHGYVPRQDIRLRHLNRVADICREQGLEPMMWSDMFIKELRSLPEEQRQSRAAEISARIPETVTLVYWDYYCRTGEKYRNHFLQHRSLTEKICFAGGAWKWSGYAPLLDHSLLAGRLALEQCLEQGIRQVMLTAWGDDGAEASLWVVLPIMQLYAECCYRGTAQVPEEVLSRRLAACTGLSWKWLMATSRINYIPGNPAPGKLSSGPAKYLLYQDPMLGLFDCHVPPDTPDHFRDCAALMARAGQEDPEASDTYRVLENLCRVLAEKATLGVELRAAYGRRDKAVLRVLEARCRRTAELTGDFLEVRRKLWLEENKAPGFEVLDLRLGGLIFRLKATADTIRRFLSGEQQTIEELEEPRLPFSPPGPEDGKYPILENCGWRHMVTAMEI